MNVVTRIPPSPTGRFHIGNMRTALFNYLYAKHHGGKFLFRIEDTDKARSKKEYEDDIVSQLAWLGLKHDGEIIRQSERTEIYRAQLQKLIAEDKAYVSKEPVKEGEGEIELIRFRNPGKSVTFSDLIRGDITFETGELGDFVIARNIEEPVYHLAVVIDDAESGVTHVMRGEDHISNTARQILIQEGLGYPRPTYAHIPLILAADRSKLSKRKHSVAVADYRAAGYLPEALTNFLALLGWSPGEDREIFSMDELIARFDVDGIQKSGAIFNVEKLRWFNREYLLKMPEEAFKEGALITLKDVGIQNWNDAVGERLMPYLRERISVWEDIKKLAAEGEFEYFFAAPKLDPARLPEKNSSKEAAHTHLTHAHSAFEALSEKHFSAEDIKEAIWQYASENGRGAVLWPLRYALSGREKSPDPFTIAAIIGKNETLERVSKAVEMLK